MASRLLIIGGGIFALMGGVHALLALLDVVRPTRFAPRDDAVRRAMQATSVRFSRGRAGMWDAWLGFNISHGVGLLLVGAGAVWLGLHAERVGVTRSALAVPVAVGLIYVLLALRFWFYVPALGFAVATACFAAAWWSH